MRFFSQKIAKNPDALVGVKAFTGYSLPIVSKNNRKVNGLAGKNVQPAEKSIFWSAQ